MSIAPGYRFCMAILLAFMLSAGLWAQAAAAPAAGAATAAPSTANNTEAGAVSAPAAPVPSGSPLVGTWKVDRAVFELFGSLKDVTAQDDRFYALLRLDANGKGIIRYGAKSDEIEIEYEIRNGQTMTIAFGSRLKPQVDLFNLLILSDGSLFLRSTRLAQVNGMIVYLLHRGN